jgi:hypothetical protein
MATTQNRLTRRSALAVLIAAGIAPVAKGRAESKPLVVVTKDPSCGCCSGWAEHLVRTGYPTKIIESKDLQSLKRKLGVPQDLASCHTAEVGGYVLEGHVPAPAIHRLLAERPEGIGLAVPGMPVGAPGMEGGAPEVYEVILFGRGGRASYGRFRGGAQI